MGFRCGIVGLPNAGKSTLFNALSATAAAEVAAYPFTTVEPNVGRIAVPDPRLEIVARLAGAARATPAHLDFVDIAGLVKGASKGEGLGNRFLAHIREVDAIAHVLRCFERDDVSHVEGGIDPVRDAGMVETELMLADLESLTRRAATAAKRARGGDREAQLELSAMEPALAALEDGKPAMSVALDPEQAAICKRFQLLTAKPVLYVSNVDEPAAAAGDALSERVQALAQARGASHVVISAAIEADIAALADQAERGEFLASLGLEEPGLDRFIRAGYALLDLITFFTANEKEAHAWTVRSGACAPEAAGVVHSDFERGFIAAETIVFDDLAAAGGAPAVKDAGKMRLKGRDDVVRDGDILYFRFNV